MAKWIEKPGLSAGQLADGDKMLLGDVSEAVGSRDKTVTLGDLRAFLGAGVTVAVTQAAHGLSVGDVIRHNGTSYVKATADTASNAEAVGVVTSVPDADSFAYQTAGHVSGLSGLTAGELYYLQDDGSLDTTAGTVEKPVLIAVSATSAVLVLAFSGPVAAEDVAFDNSTSGLTAEDVQAAIDEVAGVLDVVAGVAGTALQPGDELTELSSGAATAGYVPKADGAGGIAWGAESGGGGPVAAEDVTYDPTTSGLTAEDVQAAIDEVYAAVVAGGIPAAQGLVVVQHGDDGNAERPAAAVVLWRGSATPGNAVDGDLWDDSEDWD